MSQKNSLLAVIALSFLIVMFRLFPFQANLSPVIALMLMAGLLAQGRWYGYVLPLLATVIADVQLGFYPGWIFTYASLPLIILCGTQMKKSISSTFMTGLFGATLFFLGSNFGVWIATDLYGTQMSGLYQCYLMAIPFFRASLVGTIGGLFLVRGLLMAFQGVMAKGLFENRV